MNHTYVKRHPSVEIVLYDIETQINVHCVFDGSYQVACFMKSEML